MYLDIFYEILETVNVAGINKVIIDRTEDGVVIRGIDDDETVVVFSKKDGSIVPNNIGVHRVPAILGRLKLFDLEKSTTEAGTRGDSISTLTIKEGRKKAQLAFTNPDNIRAPKRAIDDEILNQVTLDKDDIQLITSAITNFQPEFITFKGTGDEILLQLNESDTNDCFTDKVGQNSTGDWEYHWNARSFTRLIRQASREDETVFLGIGSTGIMCLAVNDVNFILIPQVTKYA